jgi:hypothetical protein
MREIGERIIGELTGQRTVIGHANGDAVIDVPATMSDLSVLATE